jgi:hypothetical protein
MEKTVQTSVQHVESGSQTRQDGLQPVADDGGNDPPPIPNASSTGKDNLLLNEKQPVGARSQNNKHNHGVNTLAVQDSHGVENVPDWAHTAGFDHVARLLGTNVQQVLSFRYEFTTSTDVLQIRSSHERCSKS